MAETRTYQGHVYTRNGPGDAWQLTGPMPGVMAVNPKFGPELSHLTSENALQNAELGRQGAITSKANSDASRAGSDAAKAAVEARMAPQLTSAELRQKQADATVAEQKADTARAESALQTMAPNSNIHGEAYLQQFVPPQMQALVRAYARGDLGSRSGGLSTSMLPIIQHAMNFDPTTSATTFPARVKMQSDLAGNQPGTVGGSLRAMERLLAHGAEVLKAGQTLDNFGPGLLGSVANTVRTAYQGHADNPDLNHYNELVRNYAGESQKAIAQTTGGQHEREDRASGFAPSSSQASRVGSLQADAQQAYDAMGAANDQYKRLMGHDILDKLSPAAKQNYDLIMAGGFDQTGKPLFPARGWQPISGASASGDVPPSGGAQGGAAPNQPGLSPTGGSGRTFYTARDQAFADEAQQAFVAAKQAGLTPEGVRKAVDAVATKYGAQPFGSELDAAARGNNLGVQFRPYPTGHEETGLTGTIANNVGNPFGAFAAGVGNAASLGQLDNIAKATGGSQGGTDLAMQLARRQGAGLPFFAGSMSGDVAGALLTGGALQAASGSASPAVAAALAAPRTADAVYGGLQGAGNSDGSPLGTAEGVAAGLIGNATGGYLGGKVSGARTPEGVTNILPGEQLALDAIDKTGRDNVLSALAEAQRLGVPAGAADVSPELNTLTGSAIRKSPTVAAQARATLMPRGRGQYDRMMEAIGTDLGPVANIPQTSADLMSEARTSAAPLYKAAYANPVVSTPELDSLLATPAGGQALARARTIAANERRNPEAMGFSLDANGDVTLNPVPGEHLANLGNAEAEAFAAEEALKRAQTAQLTGGTGSNLPVSVAQAHHDAAQQALTEARSAMAAQPMVGTAATAPGYTTQTLDYVKRGLDDVIDNLPKGLNGRPIMDENYRAVDGVRRDLLKEVDRINPAYGDARAAYAGPAAAKESLLRGADAVRLTPNELGVQVSSQTPEQLAQMRLGFGGQLADNAGRLRYSTNPYESVLGTPAMEQRLSALYGDTPGVADLLARRDLEGQLAGSTNRLIGNSMTAERLAADSAFDANPLVEGGLHAAAAVATHGASIPGTAARLAGMTLKDRIALGLSRGAEERANQIAPLALDIDPASSIAQISGLADQQAAYQSAKALLAQQGQRPGQVVGTSVAAALLPYFDQ